MTPRGRWLGQVPAAVLSARVMGGVRRAVADSVEDGTHLATEISDRDREAARPGNRASASERIPVATRRRRCRTADDRKKGVERTEAGRRRINVWHVIADVPLFEEAVT